MRLVQILAARLFHLAIVFAICGTAFASAGEFAPAPDFLQLPKGLELAPCSAVDIDTSGGLYVLHRGKTPVLYFDKQHQFVRSWGEGLFGKPHGLRIDRQGNVWITDIVRHVVQKYTPAGKLLLSLGTIDKPGTSIDHFDRPADIAFDTADNVYVADGYGNTRVIVFDKNGKYLRQWGKPGEGPGEFNVPHAICIDRKGRILVGDRDNSRIQVFDADEKLLAMWKGFAPYGLALGADDRLYVADGVADEVLVLNLEGEILHRFGVKGDKPGDFNVPHMLVQGADKALYVTEIDGKRVQKFVPKAK
ncbi:MAG: peptidyl-alpha-hydroxyglycine alpha-amidating lyase family protein [Planctomycetota bacterium]|nr:peptidyl-alpha-hydroxyglycine alpha-amidating lyase family protein [Planctomycetota bacterium]